jgi:hypothetical protein
MSATLQFIEIATTAVQAAGPVPAAGGITDTLNGLFGNVNGLTKVGVPTIAGLVVLFLCLKEGFKFGKTVMLALGAAFVFYLSVGGGIMDIGNMFKQETKGAGTPAAVIVMDTGATDGLG